MMRSAAACLAAALLVAATAGSAAAQGATLAVRAGDSSVIFWRERDAPRRWEAADLRLTNAIEWRPARSAGIAWAEFSMRGAGEARFTRVVLVRIDPRESRITLQHAIDDGRPAWKLDRAPDEAVVALNAGMFTGAMPWGWLVQQGSERLAPGRGPLSSALIVTHGGDVEWVDGDALEAHRARHDIAVAFQSYPTLLTGDGRVPDELHVDAAAATAPARPRAADIDRIHRDARLAIGLDRRGYLLVALTRYDGLRGLLDRLPLGLTVPEMSAVMGALGARQAMLLDGGISAQLLVRTPSGTERFSGSRRVPLALLVTSRTERRED